MIDPLLRASRRGWLLVLLPWLAFLGCCAWAASSLRPDNRLEVFRAAEHAEETRFAAASAVFGPEDRVLVALRPPAAGGLGTHGGLAALWGFRERLTEALPDAVLLDVFALKKELTEIARRKASPDSKWAFEPAPGIDGVNLFSVDHAVAILVRRTAPGSDVSAVPSSAAARGALCAAVREAAQPLVAEGWQLDLAGEPENHYWLSRINEETQRVAVPILFAVIVLMLLVLFRRLRWIVVVGVAIAPGPATAMATLALLGDSLNSVTTVLPILVTTIALATTFHVLLPMVRKLSTQRTSAAHTAEIVDAVARDRWAPACLAHVTTAIAFGSLYASPVGTISNLGIAAAAALFASLLGSFHLLPALVRWMAPAASGRTGVDTRHEDGLAERLAGVIVRLPRIPVTLGALALVISTFFVLPALRVESDGRQFFAAEHPLPRGAARIAALGLPSGSVDIVFPSLQRTHTGSHGWQQLEPVLQALKGTEFLVISPQTLVDAARLVNPLAAFLPTDVVLDGVRRTVPDLWRMCFRSDGPGVRVLVLAPMGGRERWLAQRAKLTAALDRLRPEVRDTAVLTGLYPRAIAIQDGLIGTLESSLLVTGACIAFLFFCFRPRRLRWLAMLLPNLVPLALQAWLQLLTGMPLDIGTILVYGITLGLVVDGTFHILHDLERKPGHGSESTIVAGMLRRSGRALLFAAIVLAAGFATLTVSEFRPNARFGFLLAFGVTVGVIGNLSLLPMLLRRPAAASKTAHRGRRSEVDALSV